MLIDLIDRGIIRVLDVLGIDKAADGTVTAMLAEDIDGDRRTVRTRDRGARLRAGRAAQLHQLRAHLRRDTAAIARQREPVKLLVIEANGMIDIDYTGSQSCDAPSRNGKTPASWWPWPGCPLAVRVRRPFAPGLIETIGPDRVFMSVEEAVRALSSSNSPGTAPA